MNTASQFKYLRRSALSYPDLGPWAGLLFLLCFVFMSAGRFTTAPFVQLPTYSTWSCSMDGPELVISLNEKNQFYLTIYDKTLQTKVIKQVATQHSIQLSATQLAALDKLPFIGQDVRQLPAWLSALPFQRHKFATGIPAEPHNNQLAEYIAAANFVALERHGRHPFYGIRADARLPMAQVNRVFRLLQDYGTQQFSLITKLK